MRHTCLRLVAMMCLTAAPAETKKEYLWSSGNAFLAVCGVDANKTVAEETPAEVSATSDCIPYVRGLADVISMLDAQVCAPDGITNGQMEQILVKFIRDRPEKAHFLTAILFMAAMEKAFPCPTKSEVPQGKKKDVRP